METRTSWSEHIVIIRAGANCPTSPGAPLPQHTRYNIRPGRASLPRNSSYSSFPSSHSQQVGGVRSVTLPESLLFVSTLDGSLHAVSKQTGDIKWTLREGKYS